MFDSNRRLSLSEQAYNTIKDAICSGEIAPGDILSEGKLAQELNMSRTPVREALRALSSEGFVEVKNGIGAYVKQLSTKDMQDLYEVRCLLELQAVKTSIYRITNEEIESFERRFQAELDACDRGENPAQGEFSSLDWDFHLLLVDRCTNNYIKEIVADNDSNLRRYQSLSIAALNDVRESTQQHLEIIKYLKKRDLPMLLKVLKKHLQWSAGLLQLVI